MRTCLLQVKAMVERITAIIDALKSLTGPEGRTEKREREREREK